MIKVIKIIKSLIYVLRVLWLLKVKGEKYVMDRKTWMKYKGLDVCWGSCVSHRGSPIPRHPTAQPQWAAQAAGGDRDFLEGAWFARKEGHC